ncbi:MAG: hypothetical protein KKG33_14560 [candidate division Zixibacteria bacterium]|nr:hypothetical protein [candidate division Zixibacteria bacterium]MBU1471336.1 hypothetical protein [candidate division Zixibacteria bacterium]MBU2626774.1 hypothetical protein [candidate division Zixibacteria bacterium]
MGIVPKVVLRSILLAAVVSGCCLLLISSEARAGAPRVAAFVYLDSLAVTVDCAELITPKRIDMLENGYPLSFVLSVSLLEHQRIWSDILVAKVNSRFRIVLRNWDGMLEFELSDFCHTVTSQILESMDDVIQELEDRLFTTLVRISDLDDSKEFYLVVNVEYRNLTFEDVKAADRWLSDGGGSVGDSSRNDEKSVGEEVLGFLWDIAGLKAENERISGDRFRLSDLRRGK